MQRVVLGQGDRLIGAARRIVDRRDAEVERADRRIDVLAAIGQAAVVDDLEADRGPGQRAAGGVDVGRRLISQAQVIEGDLPGRLWTGRPLFSSVPAVGVEVMRTRTNVFFGPGAVGVMVGSSCGSLKPKSATVIECSSSSLIVIVLVVLDPASLAGRPRWPP